MSNRSECTEFDLSKADQVTVDWLNRYWRNHQSGKKVVIVDTDGSAEQLAETTLAILREAKDIPDGLYARAKHLATRLFDEAEYPVGEYEKGQWWTLELAKLAEGAPWTHNGRRATKVVTDFLGMIFNMVPANGRVADWKQQVVLYAARAYVAEKDRDHARNQLAQAMTPKTQADFDKWLVEELGLSDRRLPNGQYQSFGAACAHKAWWAAQRKSEV